jgi:O-antigen/teichoic acid export membrane protein
MSRFGKTLGHTFIYMAGLVLNRGVAFLLIPLFTRVFAPADYVVWDLCNTTLLLLFPMLDFGMSPAVLRFYHEYPDERDKMAAFNTSLFFVVGLHAVMVTAGLLAAPWLSRAVFGAADQAGLVRIVVLLASATALGKQGLSLLRTMERSVAYAGLNVLRGIIGPAVILALVLGLKQGVSGALWGDLVGLVFLAAATLWVCRSWLRPVFRLDILRDMLRFALPLVPVGVSMAVLTIADRYFLSHLVEREAMAPYSLGFRVGMLMALFTQSLQLSWPPSAMRMAAKPGGGAMDIVRTGYLLQVVVFAGATAIACCAPELVRVFAPETGYTGAAFVIPWIAYSYAIHGAVQVVNAGIGISKRTVWSMWTMLLSVAFKLAVTYWFILHYGIVGAAASTFLAFAFELGLTYLVTQRIVYPLPHDTRRILALYALSGACMLLALGACALPTIPSVGARAAILAAFALTGWFGLLGAADRASALSLLGGLLRRVGVGRAAKSG